MALSKDTREDILQEVDMDFVDQEPLQSAVMEEYADEIEDEALQTAIDEGFPNITDMSTLSYTIDVNPQGGVEAVAEKWINFLEDISDSEEDLENILSKPSTRIEHFVRNASDYLEISIVLLESVEEFSERNPVENIEYLANRLESDFSAEEYEGYLIEDAVSSDALNDKVSEAYIEAGIAYTPENESIYGFEIKNIRPKYSFQDIADRLAENIQESFDTVQDYLDAQFYRNLDEHDFIDYDVVVDVPDEYADSNPVDNIDYLTRRLESAFDSQEYAQYIRESGVNQDELQEKIIDAYMEARIGYSQDNLNKYGYEIVNARPIESFEDIADKLAELIQNGYGSVQNYLSSNNFYNHLDSFRLAVYDVVVNLENGLEDESSEDIDFDPLYLDDIDIENVIREYFDIRELKKEIAMSENFTTWEELEYALDYNDVWTSNLEKPSDYSIVEAEFKKALQEKGIRDMQTFKELENIDFVYDYLYDSDLLYVGTHKDSHAYVLVYKLDVDELRDMVLESED